MRPTTILTDLDGVLRLWPKDYCALENAHDLPAGSIGKTAFSPDLLEQVITGRITDRAWRNEVKNRLRAAHPSCRVEEAVLAWSEPVGEVHQDVLDLIIRCRKHCRIGLATNATDRLSDDLQHMGLAQHLDFVVNSSELGVAKPSPKFFARALALAGASTEELLFIDDTLANVRAAEQLGIRSHHFVGAAELSELMQSVGVGTNAA